MNDQSIMVAQQDRFTFKHIVIQLTIGFIVFFSPVLETLFGFWFLAIPVLLIAIIIAASSWVWDFLDSYRLKQKRRVISIFLSPVFLCLLATLLAWRNVDAQWLRFQFNKSSYEKAIQQFPSSATPKLIQWNLDGTGSVVTENTNDYIEYDEADQTLVRAKTRQPIKAVVVVRSLGGHFYLVNTIY